MYHRPGTCEACTHDPTRAKELAAKGGLTPASRVKFVSTPSPIAQAMKDMIKKTLGVGVDLESASGGPLRQRLTSGDFDIAAQRPARRLPDARQLLFPLSGRGSGESYARYENGEFDSLILKERAQRNENERRRIFLDAERLAIGRDQGLGPYLLCPAI